MEQPIAANDNIDPLVSGATLLRFRDVMRATSLGSSTIYRKIAGNDFPRPVRLGPNSVRWKAAEVSAWINGLERTGATA